MWLTTGNNISVVQLVASTGVPIFIDYIWRVQVAACARVHALLSADRQRQKIHHESAQFFSEKTIGVGSIEASGCP